MQDSPRGQTLERSLAVLVHMNREMRWCQIAGNASMDTYKTLLRLCGGSDPFSKRGSLFSRIVDDRDTMIPHKA